MFTIKTIHNTEALVANHMVEVMANYVVFHTNFTFEIDHFIEHLDGEEDKQYMRCSCCKHFFRKFADLVYYDADGIKRSVLFRDVRGVSEEARAFFNKLADVVEQGTPTKFINKKLLDVNHCGTIVVGVREEGGFAHYFGLIPNNYLFTDKVDFNEAVMGINNLSKVYKGIDKLAERVSKALVPLRQEKHFPKLRLRQLESLNKILTDIVEMKKDRFSTAEIVARLWSKYEQDASVLGWLSNGLYHFNGTTTNNIVDRIFVDGYEVAVSKFLKETAPHLYKQRNTEIASAKEMESALAALKETGTLNSLQHRLATIEDIDAVWIAPEAETPKDKYEGLSAVERAFKSKIDQASDKSASDEIIWPTPKNITQGSFISALPELEWVEFFLPRVGTFGYLSTPADPEAQEIFAWCKSLPGRNYITVITRDIPIFSFGIEAGWQRVSCVAEYPWAKDGETNFPINGGYIIGFEFTPPKDTVFTGLPSYAMALRSDLQEHRRAIDAVVADLNVNVVDGQKGVMYVQLQQGSQYPKVRAKTKSGDYVQYSILDIE